MFVKAARNSTECGSAKSFTAQVETNESQALDLRCGGSSVGQRPIHYSDHGERDDAPIVDAILGCQFSDLPLVSLCRMSENHES